MPKTIQFSSGLAELGDVLGGKLKGAGAERYTLTLCPISRYVGSVNLTFRKEVPYGTF